MQTIFFFKLVIQCNMECVPFTTAGQTADDLVQSGYGQCVWTSLTALVVTLPVENNWESYQIKHSYMVLSFSADELRFCLKDREHVIICPALRFFHVVCFFISFLLSCTCRPLNSIPAETVPLSCRLIHSLLFCFLPTDTTNVHLFIFSTKPFHETHT